MSGSWTLVHSGANPSRLNGKWKAFKVPGVLALLVKEESTARLVAAAPDLLDSLKHMTDALNMARLVMREQETRDLAAALVADAREAIAKAEGR